MMGHYQILQPVEKDTTPEEEDYQNVEISDEEPTS